MPAGERLDLPGIAVAEDNILGLDVDALQLPVARQDPQLGLQEQVLGWAGEAGRNGRSAPGESRPDGQGCGAGPAGDRARA